jgi:hypothetical protein
VNKGFYQGCAAAFGNDLISADHVRRRNCDLEEDDFSGLQPAAEVVLFWVS